MMQAPTCRESHSVALPTSKMNRTFSCDRPWLTIFFACLTPGYCQSNVYKCTNQIGQANMVCWSNEMRYDLTVRSDVNGNRPGLCYLELQTAMANYFLCLSNSGILSFKRIRMHRSNWTGKYSMLRKLPAISLGMSLLLLVIYTFFLVCIALN